MPESKTSLPSTSELVNVTQSVGILPQVGGNSSIALLLLLFEPNNNDITYSS